MKRFILSVLVLAGIQLHANAQPGFTCNYQLSHHKSEATGKRAVMNGFSGGLFYDIWVMPGVAFEPGLIYSTGTNVRTGYNSSGTAVIRNAEDAVTERYLHIPLQARIQVPLGYVTSASVYLGPTVALALSVPEGYSRSGMMFGGGVGLDLGPLTLKTGYDLGFGYRGAFTLGLAFSFGSGYSYGSTYRSRSGSYVPRSGGSPPHSGHHPVPSHRPGSPRMI